MKWVNFSDPGQAPVYFPYFFIDYTTQGWKVLLYVVVVAAYISLISFIVYRIDRQKKLTKA